MSDLFASAADEVLQRQAPLAARLRPRRLDDLVGHGELIGPEAPLRTLIEADRLTSLILWGPPGCGKTTLARLIANHTEKEFITLSAVSASVKDVRLVIEDARRRLGERSIGTILFLDEVHRFNKAQQDALLPSVEDGLLIFIGATTENPSFEVNAALLSRSQVYVLRALAVPEITTVLNRAIADQLRGIGSESLHVETEAVAGIARHANGDARVALNLLELGAAAATARAAETGDPVSARLDAALVADAMQRRALVYDKDGEEHYNLISALHKSMRNSDPDAGLYWLARIV